MPPAEPISGSGVRARIDELKQELTDVTRRCEAATLVGKPGQLFFLLRKKWTLTQHVFQAESELLLATRTDRPAPQDPPASQPETD